jgi:hypothetical protein
MQRTPIATHLPTFVCALSGFVVRAARAKRSSIATPPQIIGLNHAALHRLLQTRHKVRETRPTFADAPGPGLARVPRELEFSPDVLRALRSRRRALLGSSTVRMSIELAREAVQFRGA